MPINQNAPDAASYLADDIDSRPLQATASSSVQSGWEAAESQTVLNDFPTEVKFEGGKHQVFKFLDENGPFATYKQHFLNQKTSGKRSYVCINKAATYDKEGRQLTPAVVCPLCVKLENRPENKRAFTVVSLNSPLGMQRQMLISGARLYQALHAAQYSPQGPLTKGYWAVMKIDKGPATTYTVTPIKERDLEEDWNLDAAAAAAVVESSEPYTRSLIKEHSYEELNEIAESLL